METKWFLFNSLHVSMKMVKMVRGNIREENVEIILVLI